MRIEYIRADDIDEILNIEKESFQYPWSRKNFEETLKYSQVPQFKIMQDSEILGYLFYYTKFTVGFKGDLEILNIAIKQAFRRQGLAKYLIEYLEKYTKNYVNSFFLEVRVDNIPAIRLYQSVGFYRVGIRKKYYKNKIDAIVMKKDLKDEKGK